MKAFIIFKNLYLFLKLKKYLRWKEDSNGKIEINPKNNKPILQFVAVQRVDTDEWAIPGVINKNE